MPRRAQHDQPTRQVRYRVLKPAFVNGSYVDPTGKKEPVFVVADDGLEGSALELAPERSARPPVGSTD